MPPNPPARSEPAVTSGSELDESVSYLLKRAQVAVSRELQGLFRELDVTAVQYSVLVLADENPGIAQSELAGRLDVERPRMVPVLDKLAARGLAERRADVQDGRTRRVHLTEAGTKLLHELRLRLEAHERRITEALGSEGRDHLVTALNRLVELRGQ